MPAEIIDGKRISSEIKENLKGKLENLKKRGVVPGLAAVLVGDNPASQVYVNMKAKACEEVGIHSDVCRYPKELPESDLLKKIEELNQKRNIHGILVQFPTPEQISEEKVILAIDPKKDVDGFHPFNVGMMLAGKSTFLPCTPLGIQELLLRSGNDPSGKHVVILGRGSLVGRPLAPMLFQKAKRGKCYGDCLSYCYKEFIQPHQASGYSDCGYGKGKICNCGYGQAGRGSY